MMQALATKIDGPVLVAPVVHRDPRGFFLETYRRDAFPVSGEIDFVQDNHSRSRRGVVRGMHFQVGMAKLVRCARGAILDVVVDLRRGSPTFGQWEAFRLDDETHHQLYVPNGFAHGFCVLSEQADVIYRCTAYYDQSTEGGFRFDDPEVAIRWPADLPLIASARDTSAPLLSEIAGSLPFEHP